MNNLRIAAVVMESVIGEITNNLNKICLWVKKASKLDVDIICFPELSITGYTIHPSIFSVALSSSSKEIKQLMLLSTNTNITIMPGMAEKDNAGKLYATHMIIAPNGKIGSYRKIHLAPPEQKIFTGSTSGILFQIKKTTIGIQLCYDSHFPELSTSMALAGADVIFIPHASPHKTAKEKHLSWMRHLPARAFDNALFIISCNQAGNNGSNLNFPGNALALSPSGKIIAKKTSNKEGMMIVDLKSKELEHVRNHKMRYFLPNRREKIYKQIPIISLDS